MKKVVLFIALCFAMSSMAKTTFVWDAESHELSQTKDGITVVIAQGSGSTAPKWNVSYNEEYLPSDMRLYLGNTITVSSSTALKDIKMVFAKSCASGKDYTGLSESTGTLVSGGTAESNIDWKVDSWTGNATSVTFTLTGKGQRRIYSLVVDGEALMPEVPVEKPLPTEADLVSGYVYAEPTVVGPPDTTILKKEYAFIKNNILVHCDMGSIEKEYVDPNATSEKDDSHPAYFNCNANYTITFTASEAIKGIAISGYVRKAFNATCDHGKITFMTDPDMEMEAWPAIVITDVENKSVTLSCPKQFRCYELKVYFKDNPEPIWMSAGEIRDNEKSRHAIKLLRNGQILIKRDGQLYNAVGQQLE